MWVIYSKNSAGDFEYLCEDKIVYGEFFMSNNIAEAKIFQSKQEAIKFSDILHDKIKFNIKRDLFVAKVTVDINTLEYVGYYGGDLSRRF